MECSLSFHLFYYITFKVNLVMILIGLKFCEVHFLSNEKGCSIALFPYFLLEEFHKH